MKYLLIPLLLAVSTPAFAQTAQIDCTKINWTEQSAATEQLKKACNPEAAKELPAVTPERSVSGDHSVRNFRVQLSTQPEN